VPYSVVGGPALGFDLARLAGGDQVAAVLRAALAAGPDELERLAACHPGATPRAAWARACAAVPGGASYDDTIGGETALLRRLETSLLGDEHALDRFVRRDVLDWTWLHSGPMAVQDPVAADAADVLADAAVGGYLRGRLGDDDRRAMAAPFVRAGLPARDDAAPTGIAEVDRLLDVLAGADEPARRAWRDVVDGFRLHTAQWAPAMHQATWALSMTERLRLSCDVHLSGVLAFRRAGFTARDAAYGVWNAVAGVLQATAVGDLLPAPEAEVLLRPWRRVYGTL
jgi:hypothetical protein